MIHDFERLWWKAVQRARFPANNLLLIAARSIPYRKNYCENTSKERSMCPWTLHERLI